MAVLFSNDFAAGDFSEWTSKTDTASKLSVVGGTVIGGQPNNMAVLYDATTAALVQQDITWSTRFLRFRFQMGTNTVVPSNNFIWGLLRDSGGATRGRFEFNADLSGRTSVVHNGGESFITWGAGEIGPNSTIEYELIRSSAPATADGEMHLYIDGSETGTPLGLTGLTLDATTSVIDNLRFGLISALDAGSSGTFYMGDFIANDDGVEIGIPPAATNSISVGIRRRRRKSSIHQ